jgi:spore germination protein YaaH/flagellar hook assembly protein FlgD
MDARCRPPRLSGPGNLAEEQSASTTRRPIAAHQLMTRTRSRLAALAGGVLLVAVTAPLTGAGAAVAGDATTAAIRPSIQYEEALAHADDEIAFVPGARVSVPFTPRPEDEWTVGGLEPQPLPAGRLSGQVIRTSVPGAQPNVAPGSSKRPAPETLPGLGSPTTPPDSPILDPAAAVTADLAAAVDPGGLRREVFGFLPYWELTDASTILDWEKLSTIAYFGVGAAANGDLELSDKDGATTVGWSGWTSSKMTEIIQTAHANSTRVVLTIQSFAWNSSGVTRQKALLGSDIARANLARQIAAAVRDRGADGVNLDFEPIVSTYADGFTLLVGAIRAELDAIAPGYQLTFDTMGYIGNYPVEAATAPGGADAVVIMGYDYRNGSAGNAGSVAPIGGPVYDIADTLAAYTSRLPAAKVILGVPYYGRAWSTATPTLNAPTISAAKYGSSVAVLYETALDFATTHGRQYDPVEGVAWTTYERENCTATYGCVTAWRELYFDDAESLAAKYDLVNQYGIRGAAIWALGYDGRRPELYALIKDKFITDTVPPEITATALSAVAFSPNGDGRAETTTMSLTASGLIRYGWRVEPFFDGVASAPILEGSAVGTAAAFTWDARGADGAGVADGPYQLTIWTADASDNRAAVSTIVTVDRQLPALASGATPVTISPNGDRRFDTTSMTMTSNEPVTGRARVLDRAGLTVRTWKFAGLTEGAWAWDGTDASGATVKDGIYSFRLDGVDAAGNGTVQLLPVLVDRTIRNITWAQKSFKPGADQKDRLSLELARAATVSVSIYRGKTLVRRVWVDKAMERGTWTWAWNGRNGHRELVEPGVYTASVTTTTAIGVSHLTRAVSVKAP